MKNQAYSVFWQRIHKIARDKGFPLRMIFELTYRCNFYCQHCYVPQSYRKKKGELKTKEVFSLLNQLAEIGCFYLGFTGGEPFLREDIMEILWYAKRCGFEIIIYTNGSLIDEKIAKELGRLRPNKVDITIPAMSETAFERVTQVKGSHKKVFKAIDFLNREGVSLGFKSCVLKENEDEIKDIQGLATSLGALHRLDDMLSARLDGSREPYHYRGKYVARSTPHAVRHTTRGNSCFEERETCYVRRDTNHTLFKCGVGQTQVAITPMGELKMCLMIDYPKYKIQVTSHTLTGTGKSQVTSCNRKMAKNREDEMSLNDAWEKMKKLVASIQPDKNYKCNTCELELYCKWCPARGWLENGSFTSCDPENRRWAEFRKRLTSDVAGNTLYAARSMPHAARLTKR